MRFVRAMRGFFFSSCGRYREEDFFIQHSDMTPVQIVIFAVAYVILLTFAIGAMSAAPWVRTRKKQRELICAVTTLADDAKVYDLGCGDGAVLFSLARRHPGLCGVGYEIAFVPHIIGNIWKMLGGSAYRDVSIRCRDFFGQDYSDADAVFIFLMKPCYPRLMAKLRAELRDDAQVIVEVWPFPGIEPERTIASTAETLPMYFYRGAQLRKEKI
jgi:hypothetical protein